MSVLEPILFTYFEWMKTTSPSLQNIPQPIPQPQGGANFKNTAGGFWRGQILSLPPLTAKLSVICKIMCYLRLALGWWPFEICLKTHWGYSNVCIWRKKKQGLTRHRPMAHPIVFRYLSYSTTLSEHAVHYIRRCPAFGRSGTYLFSSVQLDGNPPAGWPHDHGPTKIGAMIKT